MIIPPRIASHAPPPIMPFRQGRMKAALKTRDAEDLVVDIMRAVTSGATLMSNRVSVGPYSDFSDSIVCMRETGEVLGMHPDTGMRFYTATDAVVGFIREVGPQAAYRALRALQGNETSFGVDRGLVLPPIRRELYPNEKDYEIRSDSRTVWVNGSKGESLARFGPLGVDVHKRFEDQVEGKGECLQCTHGPVSREDWELFVKSVWTHHRIRVSDAHRPAYLG